MEQGVASYTDEDWANRLKQEVRCSVILIVNSMFVCLFVYCD